MIVTAFGPFGNFRVNPSEVLGRAVLGDRLTVLPVSFAAVDDFLGSLEGKSGRLLMLGVSNKATNLTIERTASDAVADLPDIDNACKPRPQSNKRPGRLFSRLAPSHLWAESDDAGTYLCNYIYYQATTRLTDFETGFVHVPSFAKLPLPIQAVRLRRLLAAVA